MAESRADGLRCPNCGAFAEPGKRCSFCGVLVRLAPSAPGSAAVLVVGALPCPSCNHQNTPDDSHCSQCGRGLKRKCGTCGATVYLAARHCGRCGNELPAVGGAGTAELHQARMLLDRGQLDQAETLLAALVETTDDPATIVALATCKRQQADRLAHDVRFASVVAKQRGEALALVNSVIARGIRGRDGVEAQRIRVELLGAPSSNQAAMPGDHRMLWLAIAGGWVLVLIVVVAVC